MQKYFILIFLALIGGCSPQPDYSHYASDLDAGETMRRDGNTIFRFRIAYRHQIQERARKLLPVDVKIVIDKSEYPMALIDSSNDPTNHGCYIFWVEFPEKKYSEGVKYHFKYTIDGRRYQTHEYILKYEPDPEKIDYDELMKSIREKEKKRDNEKKETVSNHALPITASRNAV